MTVTFELSIQRSGFVPEQHKTLCQSSTQSLPEAAPTPHQTLSRSVTQALHPRRTYGLSQTVL